MQTLRLSAAPVVGQTLSTSQGSPLVVERKLGEGGQGLVFQVRLGGQPMALKWYKKNPCVDRSSFYQNLRANIDMGAPSDDFLWPKQLIETTDGSFGYLMDLCPDGYREATEFLLHLVHFASFRTAADACINVVSSFRQLHNKNLSYKDINGGNFFFDPHTGKLLITDVDNLGPDTLTTGIKGTRRYMAPEVVCGTARPSVRTDRHSMAVLVFMLLCSAHPLEGKRSLLPVLDAAHEKRLYGSEPIFIMDPTDRRNEPDPMVHASCIAIWNCLPQYMRELFERAFSQRSLVHSLARPSEVEWLRVLTRFRSDMLVCPCGNEVFTNNGRPAVCDACGRRIRSGMRLHLSQYDLPVAREVRLYRCQVSVCNADVALDQLALVQRPSGRDFLAICNTSDQPWSAITSKGEARTVAPGRFVPAKPGVSFTIEDEVIGIIENI